MNSAPSTDAAPATDFADRIGVVLMAYGTPRAVEEIEAYYTDIRRGRPPTPELLAELTERYAAIGGLSPDFTALRASAS